MDDSTGHQSAMEAITAMENACLFDDCDRTTVEHIIAQPIEETDYFAG